VSTSGTCDLCGLPVLGRPTCAEEHLFCCEGCHRVWKVASDAGIDTLLDSTTTRAERSRRAAERKGSVARASGARRETLHVDGMWCASCGLVLEDALMDVDGVLDAEVSYAGSMARVTWDPTITSTEDITERVGMLGYAARPAREVLSSSAGVEDVFLRFFVSVALGMWVMWPTLLVLYPAYVAGDFGGERALGAFTAVLSLIVLLYCGWPFLQGAWRAARVRRATMDTLVVLGTWSAWLYSIYALLVSGSPTYFESAAMITSIVLLGRWLEAMGTRGSSAALSELAQAAVEDVWLIPEDGSVADATRVPLAEVAQGSVLAVRAGEHIPADGTVLEGDSEIDRSRLTGEAIPVHAGAGDEVWAGTLNLTSLVVMRVSRTGSSTLTGRLGALMEDAVFAKSNTQRLVDSVSRLFVPVVIGVAAGAAFVSIATGLGAAEGVTRAVAVLVVACPCALGLAIPLVTTNSVAAGARNGLLIRGGPTLERSEEIRAVAFDKTGTLTLGRPDLVGGFDPIGRSTDPDELARLIAPMEAGQAHPVAEAILSRVSGEALGQVSEIVRKPGLGVTAVLPDGSRLAAGSEALMTSQGTAIGPSARGAADEARSEGELVIWVARNQEFLGGLRFADRVRAEAGETIAWLHEHGIRTALVSGDAQATCDSVAASLGIDLVYGDVLPHEKDTVIARLSEHGAVAFVGDGVNDAAALASADLAVAIGGGSDVAVWGADVVLLGGDRSPLASLPPLLRIARASRRVISQNLAWAFSYNLVTVPLAVSGRLSPIVAAAAMAISSLIVVANSARLARLR